MPNPNVGLLSAPAAQAAATCSLKSGAVLNNSSCGLFTQEFLYTEFDQACVGTFEMDCTNLTDTTGIYDGTKCPEIYIFSGCHNMGTRLSQSVVRFDQNTKGNYCYCVPVLLNKYGTDNSVIAMQNLFGFLINPDGKIALLEGNGEYSFANWNVCTSQCYGLCMNRATQGIKPFVDLLTVTDLSKIGQ